MYSSDSEFESEKEEYITKLYTELYFNEELSLKENSLISNNLELQNNSEINNYPHKDKSALEQVCINNISKEYEDRENSRKRRASICSTESISGKEPLDNLYCNVSPGIQGEEEQHPLETIQEISSNDLEDGNEGSKKENEEMSKCEMTGNKNTSEDNTLHPKTTLSFSSDDELYILPPPPQKPVTTVDINSDSNGCNNASCSKSPKVKMKTKNKLNKRDEVVILSSSSDSSDSDSEIEFLNTVREFTDTPLTLNLSSSYINSHRKGISKVRKFTKSQVIFTENRPLTNRAPSCKYWTKEMATFYDTDVSDEFSVEDIHHSQNSHPRNWKICAEDLKELYSKRRRYFQERCERCKEFGHGVRNCNKVPHCLYCGSSDHTNVYRCPQNCCLRCGGPPHSYCASTDFRSFCKECRNFGHYSHLCPDLWRRFHATTSGSVPVIPKDNDKLKEERPAYCYNCARKGHYGHECNATNRIKYNLASSEIFSYEPIRPAQKMRGNPGNLNQPSNEIHKDSSLSVVGEGNANPVLRKVIRMSRQSLKTVVGRKGFALKEIQLQSKAEITSIFSGVKQNKLIVIGTKEQIASASKFISMVKDRKPRDEYKKFCALVSDKIIEYTKELRNLKKKNLKNIVRLGENKVDKKAKKLDQSLPRSNLDASFNTNKENEPNFQSSAKICESEKPLPVCLPHKVKEATQAVSAVLSTFSDATLKNRIRSSVDFLSNYEQRTNKNPDQLLGNFQSLAKIAYFVGNFENGERDSKILTSLKSQMESSKGGLKPKLYKAISEIYTKIANPPEGSLNAMLRVAKNLLNPTPQTTNTTSKPSRRGRKRLTRKRKLKSIKKPKDEGRVDEKYVPKVKKKLKGKNLSTLNSSKLNKIIIT